MTKRRERIELGGGAEGFKGGGLGGLLGGLGAGLADPPAVATPAPKGGAGAPGGEAPEDGAPENGAPENGALRALGARGGARLRVSRAGRGGHAVTLLECQALGALGEEGGAPLARALGEALGCRAWWGEDERAVCLQGDQRARARAWLVGRGVGEGRLRAQ
ncbi:MAG: hypothetical protein FJ138_12015 [Deltaproteobacteria bacterium]|nr:hypothetical protein [Deltaproteobacteria bacterium]